MSCSAIIQELIVTLKWKYIISGGVALRQILFYPSVSLTADSSPMIGEPFSKIGLPVQCLPLERGGGRRSRSEGIGKSVAEGRIPRSGRSSGARVRGRTTSVSRHIDDFCSPGSVILAKIVH